MVMSALAHKRLPQTGVRNPLRGVIYSAIAGALMGFFYPQLMRAISPNFNSAPILPGMLTPYVALVCFGAGVLASNFVWNTLFMRAGKLTYADYFRGSARLHAIGILGGAIWMLALSFNVIASSVAGPAVSYALGQGATLVAAIWGLFIWREFRAAPAGTNKYPRDDARRIHDWTGSDWGGNTVSATQNDLHQSSQLSGLCEPWVNAEHRRQSEF